MYYLKMFLFLFYSVFFPKLVNSLSISTNLTLKVLFKKKLKIRFLLFNKGNLIKKLRNIQEMYETNYTYMTTDRLKVLNKEISKVIKLDLRKYKYERITQTVEEHKTMKVLRWNLGNWKIKITKRRKKNRNVTSDNNNEIILILTCLCSLHSLQCGSYSKSSCDSDTTNVDWTAKHRAQLIKSFLWRNLKASSKPCLHMFAKISGFGGNNILTIL